MMHVISTCTVNEAPADVSIVSPLLLILHVKPEFAITKECQGSGHADHVAVPCFVHNNHLSPSARRE